MKKSLLLVVLCCSVFVSNAQDSFNNKVLATLGNQKISVGSFLNIYTKNNFGSGDTVSIQKAVNLFINYRLKVLEAENEKMDTLSSFKRELARYREALEKPYFEDKKVSEQLLQQAFQRSRYDVRASHILIKVPPDASPADTLKAWNKIEKIRNEILSGISFKQAAIEYSEDPSARNQKAVRGLHPARRGNGGDLGYFTVFNMVYPFESAAYSTPKGQVSQPVRTKYGYHLIKVSDKRPAMGSVQVEHIFFPLKPGASKADSLAQSKRINAVYQKIKQGLTFEEAAKKYSEDKGSSYLGGRLPVFTSGRIVPQFVQQVDALKPGQISKPFQTAYGFHIIKLLSRKKPGNFKEEESYLKNKLAADQRSKLIRKGVIDRLKKEDHLKVFPAPKQQIFDVLSTLLKNGKLDADSLKYLNATIIRIGRKEIQSFDQHDFAAFVQKQRIKSNSKGDYHIVLSKLFQEYVGDKLIEYEKLHLGMHHPGFQSLMQEYHNGILLFNLTDKMVWTKASKDTAGLKKYYLEHQSNYQWKPRAQAVIMKTSGNHVAALESVLHALQNADSLQKTISRKEIPGFKYLVVDSGYYEKGDNAIIDGIKWEKGLSKPVWEKGHKSAAIVLIERMLPAGQKSFQNARGQVIADYQDLLQKQWVMQLRKKYPVHINQKVLKKLKKKYPVNK